MIISFDFVLKQQKLRFEIAELVSFVAFLNHTIQSVDAKTYDLQMVKCLT